MHYVLTINQRDSREVGDLTGDLLRALRHLPAVVPFQRSVGDEVQGVLEHPADVVEIALHALRGGRWYVGIGVGAVDRPLPKSPREGSGPAFVAARLAVDRAKASAAHVPIAVVAGVPRRGQAPLPPGGSAGASSGAGHAAAGDGARACANAEAVLRLIGRLVQDRSGAQWKVVDVLRSVQQGQASTHGTQKIAAGKLGITEQSVSRALLRSGWQEEWAARPAAEMLLSLAHGLVTGTDHPGADSSAEGDR